MKKTVIYKPLYTTLLILSLLAGLFACQPSREDNDLQNEHANTYLTDEEIDGYEAWQKEQPAYTTSRQNLIREVDGKLEKLEEQVDELSPESQEKAREHMKALQTQRTELENKLNELGQASQADWMQLKQEVDQLADSLEISIQEIDKNVEFGSMGPVPF